jgi:hypothetical protein
MAFCQLFKVGSNAGKGKLINILNIFSNFQEFQQKERQKKSAAAKDQGAEAAESADTDSYSDLSDMEVFCEQDTEEGPNKNNKKGGGKKHKKEKKPKIFFPNAFAHRDLTAPELALGYALRQFCRVSQFCGVKSRSSRKYLLSTFRRRTTRPWAISSSNRVHRRLPPLPRLPRTPTSPTLELGLEGVGSRRAATTAITRALAASSSAAAIIRE